MVMETLDGMGNYIKNIEVVGNVADDVDYGLIFIGNLRSETL